MINIHADTLQVILTFKHSNGIRFSISDLSPPTARIVPTLYQSRVGISLYDAQFTPDKAQRIPIPDRVVHSVVAALKQFKNTCNDFSVPTQNITVLATEATRTAVNSEDFRKAIKDATAWDVTLLAKEDEGRVGAMGVASSLGYVGGLMMDLGGGSTQLTWIISHGRDGELQLPQQGAVSMPFGAAALTKRLMDADREGGDARQRFADEIRDTIRQAYASLHVPDELTRAAREGGGFPLYLSGGGFRGWGFVLMSQHAVQPYPIPIINGFTASKEDFLNTSAVQASVAKDSEDEEGEGVFRISERRASQVPAVAFLVTALSAALPQIKEVRFCQGGVREGFLYSSLSREVRSQSPLQVAVTTHSRDSTGLMSRVLFDCIPEDTKGHESPFRDISPDMITALAATMNTHSTYARDIRPSSTLRFTTTGAMAAVHGLTHTERAILALLLCERWGGDKDLPPVDQAFYTAMSSLLDPMTLWSVKLLGRMAGLVGTIYPAGRVGEEQRVKITSRWTKTKHENLVLHIDLQFRIARDKMTSRNPLDDVQEMVGSDIGRIGKMGKKKNWAGGREGSGCKVEVTVGML